eukprot:CAMPEP_0177763004 /NCGR_PEP_ID=MMETSP0491_2-20121128/6641_1 /TAXON_ID=63592 /ORGANISM="Tetraselmis chuii, Strain PLY429" /LENGTH=270 /DNA_ID=CAMNT_0019279085 /DNA_START=184 /DNA_END=996 /DNA_ORIENTATION=+
MEEPQNFTYRNLKPLFPGNFAKSSTLYTYPAWTFGGRKFGEEKTDSPGPAYSGERWQSWNSKSYKFGGGGGRRPHRHDATGEYENFDNDTIAGRALIGGWSRAKQKGLDVTPGPADYRLGDGRGKPFHMAPGWGPPPKPPLPDTKAPLLPSTGFESKKKNIINRSQTLPRNPSKYPAMPRPTPGPADYDVTKQYKYGDPYGEVTFKGRHPKGKGYNNPSANHYFVHQTTLGAANRRFHRDEPEPFSTYCTHFYDSMKRSADMRMSMPPTR